MGKKRKTTGQPKVKLCVCGCRRIVTQGNFYGPACVARSFLSSPELVEHLGRENIEEAIDLLENREPKEPLQ